MLSTLQGKCLSLREQINFFQRTVERDLPRSKLSKTQLSEHLSKSIYLFSVGNNDYINNYLKPLFFSLSKSYQPQPFAQLLIDKLSQQLQRLYTLGARKVVVFELGPIGCIPSILRTRAHPSGCHEKTNKIVSHFNERLAVMLKNLTSSLPGSKFILGHVNPLGYDAIKKPTKYGLTDTRNPCCTTVINSSCIPLSIPCQNKGHFFWDGFHLTESVYSVIASGCVRDSSICTPLNMQELVKV